MKLHKKELFAVLVLAVAAPLASADGTKIDEKRALKSDGRVSVSNISGEITVTAWDRDEVHVTGTLGEGSEELRISGDAERLDIEVVMPRRSHNVEASYLRLKVPARARVDLESVSADLDLSGTSGYASLSSVSGEITVNGKMRRLDASTVSGDMKINAPSVETNVESVSGDIVVSGISGEAGLQTVSGDLTLTGGQFSSLELETVSGEMEAAIEGLTADADVDVESVSGDLELTVSGPLDATVRLDTFSGRVKSDFGGVTKKRDGRLEAKIGNGSARIRMDSHSGDLILRKK